MKDFNRNDTLFSLCGLNCALCSMKLGGYCPGCGGGDGNQSCSIARCSLEHGKISYCYECDQYRCAQYEGIDDYDSFIPHRNRIQDIEKAKNLGIEAYHTELSEKAKILGHLLECCNDGRHKTFFCVAVNLLDISNIRSVVKKIEYEISPDMLAKEKAWIAAKHFETAAKQNGIILKLNKKPANPK